MCTSISGCNIERQFRYEKLKDTIIIWEKQTYTIRQLQFKMRTREKKRGNERKGEKEEKKDREGGRKQKYRKN